MSDERARDDQCSHDACAARWMLFEIDASLCGHIPHVSIVYYCPNHINSFLKLTHYQLSMLYMSCMAGHGPWELNIEDSSLTVFFSLLIHSCIYIAQQLTH